MASGYVRLISYVWGSPLITKRLGRGVYIYCRKDHMFILRPVLVSYKGSFKFILKKKKDDRNLVQ